MVDGKQERAAEVWLARGASTMQIAIAEYTIQDHLKRIFDKVGVRRRRALAQRLYLNHMRAWSTGQS